MVFRAIPEVDGTGNAGSALVAAAGALQVETGASPKIAADQSGGMEISRQDCLAPFQMPAQSEQVSQEIAFFALWHIAKSLYKPHIIEEHSILRA